ncbi:pilus assembly PilX family protein [Ideonella livida]|uniref:Type 4 fimbrial biogenesis protein PilX N-terminal domain-containing protein n=1 Tax=Ideonella livida TaxID=2707176 RepID=A0A7C9TN98_9BURK|nr:hypothetical protein [Ideonella livida]NDY93643.1 hypothetical protein [Ideonella livida]
MTTPSTPAPKRCLRRAHHQRGAVLVTGLVTMTVITLIVVASFSGATASVKAVNNTVARDEALASAATALEQVVGSDFTLTTEAQEIQVDLDNDDTNDYTVVVERPVCVKAADGGSSDDNLSSSSLPATGSYYSTTWDIKATVTDTRSGATVEVHDGVMVQMTQTDKEAACGA